MPELAMELRAVAEDRREIVGVVAPYDETSYLVPDPGGERMRRGCFARSIAHYAERKRGGVPLYVGHNHRGMQYGESVGWDDQSSGLVGTFRVHDGPEGDDVLRQVRAGYWPAMSVGFVPTDRVRGPGGVAEVTAAILKEVSLVGMGAYDGAAVLAVRSPVDVDPVILERFHNPPAVNLAPYPAPWLR